MDCSETRIVRSVEDSSRHGSLESLIEQDLQLCRQIPISLILDQEHPAEEERSADELDYLTQPAVADIPLLHHLPTTHTHTLIQQQSKQDPSPTTLKPRPPSQIHLLLVAACLLAFLQNLGAAPTPQGSVLDPNNCPGCNTSNGGGGRRGP
ncbi:hypothetical protein PGT21_002860 [Puccinia graminis f. sp. tritici]|uniref:Uncharacterized protein n=1 Tax=Puccinia graminis f. sp. tritici TaxID=56615 RepID=A0A5B0MAA6_PUCGR|nr:hypothetical protein PGT21_002860 [Puccinia graminis f. sp. tritici]